MGADLEVSHPGDASVSLFSFAVQRHQVLGQGGKFGLFQIAEFGHGGAGGLLTCQFLGVNDEWRDRGYTAHSKSEVEALLQPFEVLFLDEVERDGETAVGTPKHLHVFHIVARKR
jgi:hypothetical protein